MRAAVLGVVLAMAPAGAWGQSVVYPDRDYSSTNNETVWRASIENDIKNGRARSGICRAAEGAAAWSDNIDFKNWAYGIANQYCDDRGAGPAQPSDKAPPPEPPATVNGATIRKCSSGMPCLGQLRSVMGIWE